MKYINETKYSKRSFCEDSGAEHKFKFISFNC